MPDISIICCTLFSARAAFRAHKSALAGKSNRRSFMLTASTAVIYQKRSINANGTHYLYLVDFTGASFIVALSFQADGKIADISLLTR